MPVVVDSEIRIFDEAEFHELAEKVIGIAFEVHNDFGRLMTEEAYQKILMSRCSLAGIRPARREVGISVQHKSFEKLYYMDLLFGKGLMVETKTTEAMTREAFAQTLHYLLLTEMQHGLLLNFRPLSVQKEYVSTALALPQRRQFKICEANWNPINQASERLRTLLSDLLNDWGAFLKISLYREAIIHFFGGADCVLKSVPIFDRGGSIGTHPFCLLAEDTALAITGLTERVPPMNGHLHRLLSHTQLRAIQWINMHNHDITLTTLTQ